MSYQRQNEFVRNERLEHLLKEINGLLAPAEEKLTRSYKMPKLPIVFIVGVLRCGSTVMLQWLGQTGRFTYPTNLLSRFYGAPAVGAKIQQLLTAPEFNFNNEILDFTSQMSFTSNLGKTKGALEPNEFWYFWRRFIPNTDPEPLDEASLAKVDGKGFAGELAALESVFQKPLAMKAHILEFNIPFLSSLLDKALFLFIHRKPFYNIQSILEARAKYYGDRRGWFSVKPKEYAYLKDLDPYEQAAGQFYFTNRAIMEGLAQIDPARGLNISYEEFCQYPETIFKQVAEKFSEQGCPMNWNYTGPKAFEPGNRIRLPSDDCKQIVTAYKKFSGVEAPP